MLLYPIWLIVAAVFLTFAVQHWRLSRRAIRPFRVREGEFEGEAGKVIEEFVLDWNRYLEDINGIERDRHRLAMVGYSVAGGLAIFSMVITLFS